MQYVFGGMVWSNGAVKLNIYGIYKDMYIKCQKKNCCAY